MYCPKCGKQLPEGAKFCGSCGNPVGGPAQTGPAVNVPVYRMPAVETKKKEHKNGALIVVLCAILALLVLIAAAMGIYYVKVLRNGEQVSEGERIEEQADIEEQEVEEPAAEAEPVAEAEEPAAEAEPVAETEEPAEPEKVVSDTYEVVGDTILESIPKSVYSYSFDEELGNAEVVLRDVPETEPEPTDRLEPQYVNGIDGEAVYLDGTYGIKLSDVGRVGESYTVSFWMRADELCDWSPFIHIGHDLLDPNARARLWLGQKTDGVSVAPILSSENVATGNSLEIRPGKSMPNTVEPNVWYHIAFTVDGSRQGSKAGRVVGTLYVAGQYIAEGDVTADTMNVDDFDVYLGINCWDVLYPVAFDDVRIWDYALDEYQIGELNAAYINAISW